MSQLGISIGIAVLAVISNTVTDRSPFQDKESPDALMQGFRAVFWTCFAMMVLSTLVGMWGLRGRRKIGTNNEDQEFTSKAERLSSPFESDVQRPVVERKPLPSDSAVKTKPRPRLVMGQPRLPDLSNKPLPELPPGPQLPILRISSVEYTPSPLSLDAGVNLDYILGLYDRSQLSLVDGQNILDECYSREV